MNGPRFALLTAILTVSFSAFTSNTEPDETDRVRFRWSFVALNEQNVNIELVQLTHDTTLGSGDQLKMYLELQTKCYVYVLHHGSGDELRLLFPADTEMFTADYSVSRKYYVPPGKHWLELDENTGVEEFYLLASAERLTQLETLLRKYKSAGQPVERQESSKTILDELRRLKKQYMKLKIAPERPIHIAGRIRGIDKDKESAQSELAKFSVEVSAPDLYCRTFTIDHH